MTTHILTMGFAPARMIESGLRKYDATRTPELDAQHYIVDQHYPLNRDENLRLLHKLLEGRSTKLLDPGRDLGLHEGLNWALGQIKPQSGDVVIVFDPDSGPKECGWDLALRSVIQAGYAVASCMDPRAQSEVLSRRNKNEYVGAFHCLVPEQPSVLSVCAWSWDFLVRAGGFQEHNAYYGGLEAAMWVHSKRFGLNWAYLPQFTEENSARELHDPEYSFWKVRHGHRRDYPSSFEQFVTEGCPGYTQGHQVPVP